MDIVTDSYKQFVEIFTSSSFHMTKNVSIMKSGIDNWSMNYCFVKHPMTDQDIDFIRNKFNVSGLLFSPYQTDERFWSIESLQPIGEFPFMLREEIPDFYKAPVYDDIEILSVSDYPMIFDDYLEIFCSMRGLDKESFIKLMNMDKLTNENHFFVAYMSDIPVGILHAINHNDDAFILDASVKENYRNTGVLNALSKKAKEHGLKNEIFNFYSIPTSEFTVKVIKDQGHQLIGTYYLWANLK